ncbi:hypothetical protein EJB05_24812, partial [Eragrostis curvula]
MEAKGNSFLLVLLLLASVASAQQPATMADDGTHTDHLALMTFKSLIRSDPSSALASWGGIQSLPPCKWRGVTCGARGQCRGRVVALDLNYLDLLGTILPSIGNLTYLRRLQLPMNRIGGAIPSELGRLLELRHVNLSYNALEGGIPAMLSECKQLENISLAFNSLSGGIPQAMGDTVQQAGRANRPIPPTLGLLKRLQVLNLYNNSLIGRIPQEIGNLTNLVSLSMSSNHLTGSILSSLGNLQKIENLQVTGNQLTEPIPSFLGNLSLTILNLGSNNFEGEIVPLQALSSLAVLNLQENVLHGSIPSWLGNLSSFIFLSLGANALTGAIPESLAKLEVLSSLILAQNNLTVNIPSSLGNLHTGISSLDPFLLPFSISPLLEHLMYISTGLQGCDSSMSVQVNMISGTAPPCLGVRQKSLSVLTLENNQLHTNEGGGWGFLFSLTNSSLLKFSDFSTNMFQGSLPNAIANLSTNLQAINADNNMIRGNIPEGIGNLVSLSYLFMGNNYLEGSITTSLGGLQKLIFFDRGMNNLSGEIPPAIGNFTLLNKLYLGQNSLGGPVPSSLGNCPLQLIDIQHNMLSGRIPKEVFLISSLSNSMYFQSNLFSGSLPLEIGSLKNIADIDLSDNRISGEIPASIGDCQSL